MAAILVLVVGLCIGGFLIYKGVAKPGTSKVEKLKEELENKKAKLEEKGIEYDYSAKYTDGEVYELKIITDALDPSFPHCDFGEYKDNSLTKDYCAAKNSVSDFASAGSITFGAFISIATIMISAVIFAAAKQRHILAFQAQQIMPIAKEGIEEMTPTMKKVMDEVTPTIANAAGEIAKSVKKGLNDSEK